MGLTYVAAIDDPARFSSSKLVGAHFGMTPKKYQSGETDLTGRISKMGDKGVRTVLYGAARIMTMPVKGDLKARHLTHKTFTDVEALDREIHAAVKALNRERSTDSLVNWRTPA